VLLCEALVIDRVSFAFLESQSIETAGNAIVEMPFNPAILLRCLAHIGHRLVTTAVSVKIAMCAAKRFIQLKHKMGFLNISKGIDSMSFALSMIESSIDSMTLELCIANEELFENLKLIWSEFCAEFVDYLCFAQNIPFAVIVARQVLASIVTLMSSSDKNKIAALWRSISGVQRITESLPEHSRVSTLVHLRKACISSDLPLPLAKSYILLAACPHEQC
jgi:hypothetical protein